MGRSHFLHALDYADGLNDSKGPCFRSRTNTRARRWCPPPGEEPIEWMLFTSEPVSTLDDATAIVDHYRARWVIEEYFKALKTGCAFERRQLMTFEGLTVP